VKGCPELEEFLAALPRPEGLLMDVIRQLAATVRSRLVYEKKVTTARTPVGEALRLGRGVCQDFAHLFLGACRGIGLPARYVSGYIHQPGEVATHAWCQVWAGRGGWVDIDPTHETFPGDDHVKIAIGRDYSDVPPNRGVWKGRARETISVSVKVEAIDRVPTGWTEWSTTEAPWSTTSWLQSQRQGQGIKLSNQLAYRQQQGQQQQAGCESQWNRKREQAPDAAYQRGVMVILNRRERKPPTRAKATCGHPSTTAATKTTIGMETKGRSGPMILSVGAINCAT
jgi:hypothetical protein